MDSDETKAFFQQYVTNWEDYYPEEQATPTKHPRSVKTSKTSTYEEGNGDYFVMGENTRRTFTSEEGAIEHARNLIDKGNAEAFYVVKVIGYVEREPTPVLYTRFEN